MNFCSLVMFASLYEELFFQLVSRTAIIRQLQMLYYDLNLPAKCSPDMDGENMVGSLSVTQL